MKEVIKILAADHEIVIEKLALLESFLDESPAVSFVKVEETLSFFENFLFNSHHKKEEEVLYAWMISQNKNSDDVLIQKIVDEHKTFHEISKGISSDVKKFLNKEDSPSAVEIVYELGEFIRKYNDHMKREESFIYEIASGLDISKDEEEKLLSKLKSYC